MCLFDLNVGVFVGSGDSRRRRWWSVFAEPLLTLPPAAGLVLSAGGRSVEKVSRFRKTVEGRGGGAARQVSFRKCNCKIRMNCFLYFTNKRLNFIYELFGTFSLFIQNDHKVRVLLNSVLVPQSGAVPCVTQQTTRHPTPSCLLTISKRWPLLELSVGLH